MLPSCGSIRHDGRNQRTIWTCLINKHFMRFGRVLRETAAPPSRMPKAPLRLVNPMGTTYHLWLISDPSARQGRGRVRHGRAGGRPADPGRAEGRGLRLRIISRRPARWARGRTRPRPALRRAPWCLGASLLTPWEWRSGPLGPAGEKSSECGNGSEIRFPAYGCLGCRLPDTCAGSVRCATPGARPEPRSRSTASATLVAGPDRPALNL